VSYIPIEGKYYIDDYFSFLEMDDVSLQLALAVESTSDPKNEDFPVELLHVSPEVHYQEQLKTVIGRHYDIYRNRMRGLPNSL